LDARQFAREGQSLIRVGVSVENFVRVDFSQLPENRFLKRGKREADNLAATLTAACVNENLPGFAVGKVIRHEVTAAPVTCIFDESTKPLDALPDSAASLPRARRAGLRCEEFGFRDGGRIVAGNWFAVRGAVALAWLELANHATIL